MTPTIARTGCRTLPRSDFRRTPLYRWRAPGPTPTPTPTPAPPVTPAPPESFGDFLIQDAATNGLVDLAGGRTITVGGTGYGIVSDADALGGEVFDVPDTATLSLASPGDFDFAAGDAWTIDVRLTGTPNGAASPLWTWQDGTTVTEVFYAALGTTLQISVIVNGVQSNIYFGNTFASFPITAVVMYDSGKISVGSNGTWRTQQAKTLSFTGATTVYAASSNSPRGAERVDFLRFTRKALYEYKPAGTYPAPAAYFTPPPVSASLLIRDTLADGSTNALSVSAVGTVSTAGDGLAPDATGHVTVANDPALSIGSNDFTFETWFKPDNTLSGARALIGRRPSLGTGADFIWSISNNAFYFRIGGTLRGPFGSALTSVGAWAHLAVTRDAGVMRFWRDGAQIGTDTTFANAIADDGFATTIGAFDGGATSNPIIHRTEGEYQDVRITVGTARYAAAFTPPARGSL